MPDAELFLPLWIGCLAANELGRTGDESAVPALTSALEDPVAEVRSAASRSLDVIRNPETVTPSRFGSSVFIGR